MAIMLLLTSCQPPLKKPTVTLPKDIQQYVHNIEKDIPDIKKGTHKKIYWYTKTNEQSDLSVIFVHGFAGSRLVYEPNITEIAQKMKANYFATRITGHGQPSKYLQDATAQKWLQDAHEALEIGKRIGKKVIAICHSTGCPAMLSLLAKEPASHFHSIILISPNYGPKNRLGEALLWPGGLSLVKKIHGEYGRLGYANLTQKQQQLKKQFQAKINLSVTEIFPMESVQYMMQLVHHARITDHRNIKTPILFIYSQKDKTININRIERLKNKLSKATVSTILTSPSELDLSNHLHIGAFTSPKQNRMISEEILRFLKNPQKKLESTI